jgi:two-component system NtrC family sensor kinase
MAQSREKILVVASDPTVLDIITRQALAAAGFVTSMAKDFATAMEAIDTFKPDAMILDVKMAGMNASDLIMALSTQGIELPVIALASKGDEGRVIQAFRVGAVDYLLWPAKEPEVISVVERALKQLRVRREREHLALQLQQRVQDLTTISHMGKAVTSTTNLSELFNKILQAAIQSSQADSGWLCILEGKVFNLVSCHNLPENISKKIGQPWNDGISLQVVKTGKPYHVSGDELRNYAISTFGLSIVVLPIIARQQVIGMLSLMRKDPKPFTDSDLRMLEALGDYAAISLANSYLFHANEERARSLQYSIESFKMNQKVSYTLVLAVKQEIQSSIKKIGTIYRRIMMSDTSQLQLKQQERMVQLNVEITNLASLADAMSLPLLERPSLSRSRVLVNELIRSELGQMEPVFKHINVQPLVSMEVNNFLNCQPSLMGAIIRGIISQGLRYSRPGEELHIDLDPMPNGSVQIKVEAIGETVTQQQLDRLFMQNSSFSLPPERKFLGIGLEPSIIRELIHAEGGDFSIEPLEMGGIRFRAIFPEG